MYAGREDLTRDDGLLVYVSYAVESRIPAWEEFENVFFDFINLNIECMLANAPPS